MASTSLASEPTGSSVTLKTELDPPNASRPSVRVVPIFYVKCQRTDRTLGPLSTSSDVPCEAFRDERTGASWELVEPIAVREGEDGAPCYHYEVVTRRQYTLWLPGRPPPRCGEPIEISVECEKGKRAVPQPLLRFDPESPFRTERHIGAATDVVTARFCPDGLLDVAFGFRYCSAGRGCSRDREEHVFHLRVAYPATGQSVFGPSILVAARTRLSSARRSTSPESPDAGVKRPRAGPADDVESIADPFSFLSIGAFASEAQRKSCADARPSAWVDDSIVNGLESVYSVSSGAAAGARDGGGRRFWGLFAEAADLVHRIQSACGMSTYPPQASSSKSAPHKPRGLDAAAALRRLEDEFGATPLQYLPAGEGEDEEAAAQDLLARLERPPGPTAYPGEAERAAGEARVAAAIARLPAGADDFVRLLTSEPLLDSRYVLSSGGHKELRAALRAVRAAVGSVGPEQTFARFLLAAAAHGLADSAHGPLGELRTACKRAWGLSSLVLHDNMGLVLDLVPAPHADFLALAGLAADAARAREGEDPALCAEALYWLGARSFQARQDEAGVAHHFAAWSVLRSHGLYPSRLEAQLIRDLCNSYLRRNMLREAGPLVDQIYWFEDGPMDGMLQHLSVTTLLLFALKTGRPLEGLLAATAATLHRLPPEHADSEVAQATIPTVIAFIHLRAGSYFKAVVAYREAIACLARTPWSYMADFVTSFAVNFAGSEPASMARGLRVAAGLQRLFDWTGSTPVLAHFLSLLGRLYLRCGDAASARAAFAEALAAYGGFAAIFPPDHPRLRFLRAALDACASPPPTPAGPL